MNEKKILKQFTKWVDEQFDFKSMFGGMGGTIAELADGPVFSIAINSAFDKIPDEHKQQALQLLQAITEGDHDLIESLSVDKIVEIINTPLGDTKEKILVEGILGMAINLYKLSRKKAA